MDRRFLSLTETAAWTGLSRSTVLRWAAAGQFPAKVHLGPFRIAFDLRDLERWAAERTGVATETSDNDLGAA